MAGRGLNDVFDYFVSPEEQREARERSGAPSKNAGGSASRCGLIVDGDRPLSASLAVDLARGLATHGRARILSPFSRPALLPVCERIDWQELDTARTSGPGRPLQLAFDACADPTLVIVPPAQLSTWATDLVHAWVRRLVLPVDPMPVGAARALSLLRAIEPWSNELAIGALVVGARTDVEGDRALRELIRSARRELDIDVEALGSLQRDASYDRALLAGRALLDFDHESSSARTLAAVCERLAPEDGMGASA